MAGVAYHHDKNQILDDPSDTELWYTFDDDTIKNGHNLEPCSIVLFRDNNKNGEIVMVMMFLMMDICTRWKFKVWMVVR